MREMPLIFKRIKNPPMMNLKIQLLILSEIYFLIFENANHVLLGLDSLSF